MTLHPQLRGLHDGPKILFVRSRLESLYWGLLRPYLPWLKNWILIYEAHDLGSATNGQRDERFEKKISQTRRALSGFDLVISVTRSLSEEIGSLTQGAVQPHVLPLGSGLQRLGEPPKSVLAQGSPHTVLGYTGTVDQLRGVDQIINALRFLPDSVHLRIVGRILPDRHSTGMPNWLLSRLEDPAIRRRVSFCSAVPYAEVAQALDRCDIMIQPSGLLENSYLWTISETGKI